MPVKFFCPCGQKLAAKDGQTGKRVRCPTCHRLLITPIDLLNHTEMNDIPPDDEATRTMKTVDNGDK